MRVVCVFIGCLIFASAIKAQEKTGVWRGVVIIGSTEFRINNNTLPSFRETIRGGRINENSETMRTRVNGNNEYTTRAKLEMIEADERMLAQLTSYGDDNSLVTMYQFYVRPTPKDVYKYHLEAKSVVVNETIKKADLFDLRGSFFTTDSGMVFQGIWEEPFGKRKFGTFSFRTTNEPVTINPELWHGFLKKNHIDETILPVTRQFKPLSLYDTLVTEAPAVYGNMIDNGMIDQDTLSIWLNGRLIEDDIVPGKKPFYFRVSLGEQEWNYLSIRCKSEGKEKGAGVHLNLQIQDIQLKYNLALYQYHQAEWVIRRKNPVKSK